MLGGDHSCAIGTWTGIAQAIGPLGLIWIDAHMDAHTPETTPSGMLHGMPVASLLGHGGPRLAARGSSAFDPRRVCLVGVRSFEAAEAALLDRLGVRVFSMFEVRRRGLAEVMAEALAIARDGAASFGISLDLDAIDPRDAPAVGTAVPGGIRAADLRDALARLGSDPGCAALEITEYNPYLDRDGVTVRLVADIAESLLAPARIERCSIPSMRRRMNGVIRPGICLSRTLASVRSGADGPARAPKAFARVSGRRPEFDPAQTTLHALPRPAGACQSAVRSSIRRRRRCARP